MAASTVSNYFVSCSEEPSVMGSTALINTCMWMNNESIFAKNKDKSRNSSDLIIESIRTIHSMNSTDDEPKKLVGMLTLMIFINGKC